MPTALTQREGQVHRDDCAELFLDTNHDSRTYYHAIINTLGTVHDKRVTA